MQLLSIEDDPNDIELATAALARAGLAVVLTPIADEIQAIDYLTRRRQYADQGPEIPAVIFLDLELDNSRGVRPDRGHPR